MSWKEEKVQNLKDAAQTIIDNAETMIGGYKHQIGDVDIHVCISGDQLPRITVSQELAPDQNRILEKISGNRAVREC